jgi:hypothetical protein
MFARFLPFTSESRNAGAASPKADPVQGRCWRALAHTGECLRFRMALCGFCPNFQARSIFICIQTFQAYLNVLGFRSAVTAFFPP